MTISRAIRVARSGSRRPPSDLDRSFCPERLAQATLEDLAAFLARQGCDEIDTARDLELGQPARDEFRDLCRGDGRSRLEFDRGADLLAEFGIGDAEHG